MRLRLDEDKVSDYIKRVIAENCNYSKEELGALVSELPQRLQLYLRQSNEVLYKSCVEHGMNLMAYLRLYFLSYFDISHGKGPIEYALGIARIAIGELGMFRGQNVDSELSELKQTVLFLHGSDDEALRNMYDGNLNGLSYEAFVSGLKEKRLERNRRNRERLQGAVEGNAGNYEIIPIEGFDEASKYGKYTSWCITKSVSNYNNYERGGRRFYFCLGNGFENVPKVVGENCPLDEYGMSMIAVLVNAEGEPDYITTRWNHDHDGENNPALRTAEQFQEKTGINFYSTFKPYTKEELHARGITLFEDVPELLASGVLPKNIFDRIYLEDNGFLRVTLQGKYNYVNGERQLVSKVWFANAEPFIDGLAEVSNGMGESGLLKEDGTLVNDRWYDAIYGTVQGEGDERRPEYMRVKQGNSWNFMNKEGKFLFPEWIKAEYMNDFHEGFAIICTESLLYNFVNMRGQLLSREWFMDALDFHDGLALVTKNGNMPQYNYIRTDGTLLSSRWFDYCGQYFGESHSDLIVVRIEGRYNYMNKGGQIISNEWFDKAEPFHYGIGTVRNGGKYNFISTEGKLVSRIWFDKVLLDFDGDNSSATCLYGDNIFRIYRDGRIENVKETDSRVSVNEGTIRKIVKEAIRLIAESVE